MLDRLQLELLLQTGTEIFGPVFDDIPKNRDASDFLDYLNTAPTSYDMFHLMNDAVRKSVSRYDSVALFLSGGVDSTSLLSLLSQTDTEVIAYHTDWKYPSRSELHYAKTAADLYGVELRVVNVSAEAQSHYLEEALVKTKSIDYTATAVYMACKQVAADGLSVAVNALGLDEYLAGYPIHRELYYRRDSVSFFPYIRTHRRALRFLMQKFGNDKAFFMRKMFPYAYKPFLRDTDASNIEEAAESLYARCASRSRWDLAQRLTIISMIENFETVITRIADTAGVTMVFPYIDKPLADYCLNLPPAIKENKAPLRNLLHFLGLPNDLARRGADWSDLKKWDKYAWGGTTAPYVECLHFMESLFSSVKANAWFSDFYIKKFLSRLFIIPQRPGLQMLLFLKLAELMNL